jgi:hypothetical protein
MTVKGSLPTKDHNYQGVSVSSGSAEKSKVLVAITKRLKSEIDEKKYVDVTAGSKIRGDNMLRKAIRALRDEGYEPYWLKESSGDLRKILAVPNTSYGEVLANRYKIKPFVRDVTGSEGLTAWEIKYNQTFDDLVERIKNEVDEKTYVSIEGESAAVRFGVSWTRLASASVFLKERDGYPIHSVQITDNRHRKVITLPGKTYEEVVADMDLIENL